MLQADGGVTSACINASTLALVHAGVELVDYVVSCTASINKLTPMLDVTQQESVSGCEVTVSILPNKGSVVSLDSAHTLHLDQLEEVIDLAIVGCQHVYKAMSQEVETYLQDKHAIMSHR